MRALLFVLLAGCATVPAGFKPYNVNPVLMAWLDDGLPRGDCRNLDVRVLPYTDQALLNRACGTPSWACARAGSPSLIRAISNNPAHEFSWLIAHEVTHILAACGLHNSDGNHLDHRLWGYYDTTKKLWVEAFENHAHKVITK